MNFIDIKESFLTHKSYRIQININIYKNIHTYETQEYIHNSLRVIFQFLSSEGHYATDTFAYFSYA